MSYYIRTKEGMPVLRDFASNEGTPIVIDVTTRIAYFLWKNNIFPLAPNPSSTGAFDDGFSNGFS
jgi:hypothetical protein